MNGKYILFNIVETLLRMIPLRCKTGLTKVGNPDRNSPVFLTCNYHLTVERVKRALQGMDCYLLVANTKGVNVWCAATGGHLTSHSVISVLKTSGIETMVDHKTIILPQLAAAGIETRTVTKKTGWHVVWGPVYAKDIFEFTKTMKKTQPMKEVTFPVKQRIEMGAAWAFPISVILGLIMFFFWREAVLPVIFLVWGLAFVMYVSFPGYSKWLKKKVFTEVGNGGIQLVVWVVFMVILAVYSTLAGIPKGDFVKWSITSLVIVLMVGVDLMGTTPVYKSGLHEERLFKVVIDEEKCRGAGFCEHVCPRNCFKVDRTRHTATLQRDQCIQCGACIVQCPFDALHFESPTGEVLPPETIRKYKLTLMGSRRVQVGK